MHCCSLAGGDDAKQVKALEDALLMLKAVAVEAAVEVALLQQVSGLDNH